MPQLEANQSLLTAGMSIRKPTVTRELQSALGRLKPLRKRFRIDSALWLSDVTHTVDRERARGIKDGMKVFTDVAKNVVQGYWDEETANGRKPSLETQTYPPKMPPAVHEDNYSLVINVHLSHRSNDS